MDDSFDPQGGDLRAETVNIREGGARNVYAGSVSITMGGVRNVSAETVTIRQSGAQSVEAQSIAFKQGGALQVAAEHVDLAASGVGLIRAGDVRVGPGCNVAALLADKAWIEESLAPVLVARQEVHLDQSAAGVIVANRVGLTQSAVVLAVAETVEGDARVQVKPQVAAIFGAAFGAALAVTLLWGRRG